MGDLGPTLAAVATVGLALTTIAVALRFYVRLVLLRRFAVDDYLILICQLLFIAYVYCTFELVKYGAGKHLVDVVSKPDDLANLLLVRIV